MPWNPIKKKHFQPLEKKKTPRTGFTRFNAKKGNDEQGQIQVQVNPQEKPDGQEQLTYSKACIFFERTPFFLTISQFVD